MCIQNTGTKYSFSIHDLSHKAFILIDIGARCLFSNILIPFMLWISIIILARPRVPHCAVWTSVLLVYNEIHNALLIMMSLLLLRGQPFKQ